MSQKKIIFQIKRMNWYRLFSPLIAAAEKHGYQVECWHNISLSEKSPVYEFPRFDLIDQSFSKNVKFKSYEGKKEFLKIIQETDATAFVSLTHPAEYTAEEWPTRKARPFYVFLEPSPCDWLIPLKHDWLVEAPDWYALTTPAWFQLSLTLLKEMDAVRYQPKWEEVFSQKMSFIGWPQSDPLPFDRDQCLDDLGIPRHKKVVLYCSYPANSYDAFHIEQILFHQPSLYRKLRQMHRRPKEILRGLKSLFAYDLAQTVKAIKLFCLKNDALFVIKARSREDVLPIERDHCDRIYFDDSYYPSTMYKLMTAASVSFGYHTMSGRESVVCQTPHYTLDVCGIRTVPTSGEKESFFERESKTNKFFNTPGLTGVLSEAEIRKLPNQTIADLSFQSKNFEEFNTKYLGYSQTPSASTRFFEELELRLKKESG